MRRAWLLLAPALLLAACIGSWAAPPTSYQEISHDDLVAAMKTHSVFLIDCNSDDEYRSGHIPGAIHYFDHQADLARLLPPDRSALIVAYCSNPH